MKRMMLSSAILCLLGAGVVAQNNMSPVETLASLGIDAAVLPATVDTVMTSSSGVPLHVVTDAGEVMSVGYYSFTPAMRTVLDRRVILMAEGAVLDRVTGASQPRYAEVRFTRGNPRALQALNDDVLFGYEGNDKGEHFLSWEFTDGSVLEMQFPLDYMSLSGKSRGEMEEDFMQALGKVKKTRRASLPALSGVDPVEYKNGMTYLKGDIFRIPEVSRNVYMRTDASGRAVLVADEANPCETLANMVVCGVGETDPALTLRVLTHNYGEIREVHTTLGRFLQHCEREGCKAYFGVKSVDGEKILASVYLRNPEVGYVHVLGLNVPLEALRGEGEIVARTSLYVPVNNVADLYYEQRARTTPIKIKIEK